MIKNIIHKDLVFVKLLLFLIVLFSSFQYLSIENNKKNYDDCILITYLNSRDSVFNNPVYICSDSTPIFYYSFIRTSVCSDTLCQLVNLKVYWDLAGNYIRFDTLSGFPLTKYDHLPFTTRDYSKLHTTLSNRNSILGERTEKELVEKNQVRYSEKTDAVTGGI